jgi:hypothetical protein
MNLSGLAQMAPGNCTVLSNRVKHLRLRGCDVGQGMNVHERPTRYEIYESLEDLEVYMTLKTSRRITTELKPDSVRASALNRHRKSAQNFYTGPACFRSLGPS